MKITKSKLKQLIKEELALFTGLEVESNFIKKNNLKEHEESMRANNFELEQMVATWDTSIRTDGSPRWTKRHETRKAFIVPNQAAGEWNWVVLETLNDEEADIAQGAEASFGDAILSAEAALKQ